MMKTVGIITLPLNYNYGGLLQAYALSKIVENYGYKPFIIDWPLYPALPLFTRIKCFISHFILRKKESDYLKKRRDLVLLEQNTRLFIDKTISVKKVPSLKDIRESDFDMLLVGSDQIWRYKFLYFRGSLFDAYLDFARKWNVKRIAYAVSFGVDFWEYDNKSTERCRYLASLFQHISVREISGVKLCSDYLGVSATHVLDPTMLLKMDSYLKLIEESKVKNLDVKNKVFCYILDNSLGTKAFVDKLAKEIGLEISFLTFLVDDMTKPVRERIPPSVEYWLDGIRSSEYVITDSFHACVFSLLFNKPFIVIANENRGIERVSSFLRTFGLEDRLLKISQTNFSLPVSSLFSAQDILKSKRTEALNYLRYILDN